MVSPMAQQIRHQQASHWNEVEGGLAQNQKARCDTVEKHLPPSLLVATLLQRFANAVAEH